MNRIPVSVLGATGVVGRRFMRRLASHPYHQSRPIAASGSALYAAPAVERGYA